MKRMHERGETVGQIITKEESRAGHEGDWGALAIRGALWLYGLEGFDKVEAWEQRDCGLV
jgi:hypothetical protein